MSLFFSSLKKPLNFELQFTHKKRKKDILLDMTKKKPASPEPNR